QPRNNIPGGAAYAMHRPTTAVMPAQAGIQ
ncbi:MAG: hypothetical protein JWP29_5625, partial [Rhodoferax sp.]|nr:hypothetical protein [Rhodoferax sp.]